MKSLVKKIISVTTLAIATSTATAAFIDHNTYLTDTDSGLDWLDVTESVNMSYDYVSSQFSTGGQFEGWRYATGDEFNALLAGLTGIVNNGWIYPTPRRFRGLDNRDTWRYIR